MIEAAVELALKKQRLLLKSAALRDDWMRSASALKPLCTGVDRVRDAGTWLRRHPELLVAAGVAVLVARPRAVFRWVRRAVSAVLLWRRLRDRLTVVLHSD